MNTPTDRVGGPSTPVEVLGLGGMPLAGDAFQLVKNEKDAKKVVQSRVEKSRQEQLKARQSAVVDPFAALGETKKEIQNVILKADVAGPRSVEGHSLSCRPTKSSCGCSTGGLVLSLSQTSTLRTHRVLSFLGSMSM